MTDEAPVLCYAVFYKSGLIEFISPDSPRIPMSDVRYVPITHGSRIVPNFGGGGGVPSTGVATVGI